MNTTEMLVYKSIDNLIIRGRNLQDILDDHKKWLLGPEIYGLRADLSHADLSCADLSCANLSCANLSDADLSGADLSGADLSCANLSGANLSRADLTGADLTGANLSRANLRRANLSGANLSCANLSDADLSGADLRGANLSRANLSTINYDSSTAFFHLQCPEKGQFTGFKKCRNYIVELEIQANALRSSATSRKCRCSAAKVISITEFDGSDSGVKSVTSNYDSSFIYRIGETVSVPNFDKCRWDECSTGIHFFITREEAVLYTV